MKLYQYPKCSTCRKAVKFLNAQGIEFSSIDISQQPPNKAELNAMLKSYGGDIRKLFNTSGMQYRELQLKEKLPSMNKTEAINLLAGNGMLIKRPFLLNSDKLGLVGFKQETWQSFIR